MAGRPRKLVLAPVSHPVGVNLRSNQRTGSFISEPHTTGHFFSLPFFPHTFLFPYITSYTSPLYPDSRILPTRCLPRTLIPLLSTTSSSMTSRMTLSRSTLRSVSTFHTCCRHGCTKKRLDEFQLSIAFFGLSVSTPMPMAAGTIHTPLVDACC